MKSQIPLLTTLLLLGGAGSVAIASNQPVDPDSVHVEESDTVIAQSSAPTTYMTPQGPNEIVVQITDDNFYFRDVLYRSYGNFFQGIDHGYRVIYDRDSGRVTVIFDETGAEVYNYFFTEASSGLRSRPGNSDSYPQPTPETYLTRESADEYVAELIEGEFYFYGTLTRTTGNHFIGSDNQVRVMYDADTGRVVVINVVTGTEFYNYFFSEVDEGFL